MWWRSQILLRKISPMPPSKAAERRRLYALGGGAGWGGLTGAPILQKISISILIILILWARRQIELIFEL